MASVTGFARRYRSDLFFQTEVDIVVLQTTYAVLIFLLAEGAVVFLYHEAVGSVSSAIATALDTHSMSATGIAVIGQLQASRGQQVVELGLLILSATAIFGFLVARLALAPARAAYEAQKRFIGNIAHELRTPLAIIKTNTEVRLLDEDISRTARKMHESNLEELDRISDTINNLLSLNALVRPEKITFTEVNIGEVARRVVGKLAFSAHQKRLRIKVNIGAGSVVWGNATAIEQIATNLIKNAIQYTAAGDIIIMAVPNTRGALEFSVRDTGMGINRDDLFRIFEPFYRGDSARTRTGGAGSGLGLAIVSELVKMHRGRVEVKSAPGHGTTVTVTLPQTAGMKKVSKDDNVNEVFADFSNERTTRG